MLDWLRRRLRPKWMRDLPLYPRSLTYRTLSLQTPIPSKVSFAPSIGLRDVPIGLGSLPVSLPCDRPQLVIVDDILGCSKCGLATGTDLTGCLTPTTTP